MALEFETRMAKDLYWVPLTQVGAMAYSLNDLSSMTELPPEEKQKRISSLADAVGLFRVSDFQEKSDTQYLTEDNGITWEHHKPGYEAVLTNEGCCASCASWLAYILSGRYEKMGLISYMRPNGNGHCINYIYHDGWYYFIDMSLQIRPYRDFLAKETGNLRDYFQSKPFANIFLKGKHILSYVEYLSKYQKLQNRIFLFSSCDSPCAPPMSMTMDNGKLHLLYPSSFDIQILNADQAKDVYTFAFVPAPLKRPCW